MSEIINLGDNPKLWLTLLSGLLLSMIVGRFVQAFRNGAGIKDAALSVWLGTNTPTKKDDQNP